MNRNNMTVLLIVFLGISFLGWKKYEQYLRKQFTVESIIVDPVKTTQIEKNRSELEDLAELRLHTEIPIALDESIIDLNSAKQIIENRSSDIFVIKPMIIGSLSECLAIINLGKENNIKSVKRL